MERRTIRVSNEIKLDFEVWGAGSGSPILFLSGGPGEKATDLRPHLPWQLLADQRPIILLNQRGTDLQPGPWEPEPGMWEDRNIALKVLKNQAHPPENHIDHTPWEGAKDIARIADHFGLDRIDIIAHSYGTHLTMAAMKAVPERLGRMVMLGFEGPDQTYKLPGAFQNCPEPPPGPEFGLRWMLSGWFGLENRMRRLIEFQENPGKFLASFEKVLAKRSPMFYLHDAASHASADRLERIAGDKGSYEDTINFPFPEIAEAYGVTPLPDSYREDPVWEREMLVFTGEKDVFTPTQNFLEAGKHLKKAHHEEVAGAYHDTLLLSEKIAEKWFPFFLEP